MNADIPHDGIVSSLSLSLSLPLSLSSSPWPLFPSRRQSWIEKFAVCFVRKSPPKVSLAKRERAGFISLASRGIESRGLIVGRGTRQRALPVPSRIRGTKMKPWGAARGRIKIQHVDEPELFTMTKKGLDSRGVSSLSRLIKATFPGRVSEEELISYSLVLSVSPLCLALLPCKTRSCICIAAYILRVFIPLHAQRARVRGMALDKESFREHQEIPEAG